MGAIQRTTLHAIHETIRIGLDAGARGMHVTVHDDEDLREAVLDTLFAAAHASASFPIPYVVQTAYGGDAAWDLGRIEILTQEGVRAKQDAREPFLNLDPTAERGATGLERFAKALLALARSPLCNAPDARGAMVVIAPAIRTKQSMAGDLHALLSSASLGRLRWCLVELGAPRWSDLAARAELRSLALRHDEAAFRAELVRSLRAQAEAPGSVRARGGAGPARRLPDWGAEWVGAAPRAAARAQQLNAVLASAAAAALEGRFVDAVHHQSRACELIQATDDVSMVAAQRVTLAIYLQGAGDPARAQEVLTETISQARERRALGPEVVSRQALAALLLTRDLHAAIAQYANVAVLQASTGDLSSSVETLLRAGQIAETRDESLAVRCFREGARVAEQIPAGQRLAAFPILRRLREICALHGLTHEVRRFEGLLQRWTADAVGEHAVGGSNGP